MYPNREDCERSECWECSRKDEGMRERRKRKRDAVTGMKEGSQGLREEPSQEARGRSRRNKKKRIRKRQIKAKWSDFDSLILSGLPTAYRASSSAKQKALGFGILESQHCCGQWHRGLIVSVLIGSSTFSFKTGDGAFSLVPFLCLPFLQLSLLLSSYVSRLFHSFCLWPLSCTGLSFSLRKIRVGCCVRVYKAHELKYRPYLSQGGEIGCIHVIWQGGQELWG